MFVFSLCHQVSLLAYCPLFITDGEFTGRSHASSTTRSFITGLWLSWNEWVCWETHCYDFEFFIYVSVYLHEFISTMSAHVPTEAKTCRIPWRWSRRWLWAPSMWALGTELWISGRAASVLNYWAISPTLVTNDLNFRGKKSLKILQQSDECVWGYANWLCSREHQCLSPSHPRNSSSLLSQQALKEVQWTGCSLAGEWNSSSDQNRKMAYWQAGE